MSKKPVIVIHGGAWAIPDKLATGSIDGVKEAAVVANRILQDGGTAVDAVEAAIIVLENHPAFDAGYGSVLNANGEVEMDAVLMAGHNLQCGGVACVQNIRNPIKLARAVMEKTDHTLLVGLGANQFAEEIGMEKVPTDELVTEDAKAEWREFMKFRTTVNVLFRNRDVRESGCDTVGAVALDAAGNVAFGTSTGGITAKRPGRVGDSPIIGDDYFTMTGSGGYADNMSGAVSTTGHGESIVKVCLARQITFNMEQGLSAQQATEKALESMANRVQGSGGAVTISKDGDIGKHFTTERMAWSWIKDGQLHYGLNPGEDFSQAV